MQERLKPATSEAMQLLMEGSVAMARIEAAGIRIDVPYLKDAIVKVTKQIAELGNNLRTSQEYKAWVKQYGVDMKPGSRNQLGVVIFDVLGHKRNPFMGKSNDAAAFEHLQLQFIKDYQNVERLKKALKTNLYGILNETVNGYVHPFFSLAGGFRDGEGSGGAESYRPSGSKPNFQNMPIRNKMVAEIVRSSVIPRKGNVLVDVDYKTQEVRVSYCYHQDPKLRRDVLTGDMHKDRAKELFLLSDEELGPTGGKDIGGVTRYVAKNGFVFAEFYGSFYKQCAPRIWDFISTLGLKTAQGLSMYEHLQSKGITHLGPCNPDDNDYEPSEDSFEYVVKCVESKMWRQEYTVYDQWKKDWWEKYKRLGGINTLTGFTLEGVFRRNQILCDPIQGSAFHCLLWAIIEIQKILIKRKMKAKIICQVHDSLTGDVPEKEVDDFVQIVRDVMIAKVTKHFSWVTIPLEIDMDVCYENWFKKSPLTLEAV